MLTLTLTLTPADSGRGAILVLRCHSHVRNICANNAISDSCRRERRNGGNEEGSIQNHD